MLDLHHLLDKTDDINTLEMCIRAAVVCVYGLVAVRLAGRRVFGRWSALDIVVSILVGSNLSRIVTGNVATVPALAATSLILLLHWLLAQVVVRSSAIGRIVEARAVTLAEGGKLKPDVCLKRTVSQSDLNEALRQEGVSDPSQTRLVTLEPSGKISVLKK